MTWWRMATRYDTGVAASWFIALVLSACGGKAVTETDGRESSEHTPRSPSGSPSDAGAMGHELDSTLELGDCDEGWLPGEAPCPWLASNDLCYPTKEAACACICPAEANTICSSGLPGGADDRVRVSCN